MLVPGQREHLRLGLELLELLMVFPGRETWSRVGLKAGTTRRKRYWSAWRAGYRRRFIS